MSEGLDDYVIGGITNGLLNGEKVHLYYSNDEVLHMIEGISNYEIVGDWQRFYTVKSEYLFKLSEDNQRQFARNFSIGNKEAENCLMELWKNKIPTTGVDVIRPEAETSTYYIAFNCASSDTSLVLETLRKNVASR